MRCQRWIAPALLVGSLTACSGSTERSGSPSAQPASDRSVAAVPSASSAFARRHWLMVVELEPLARAARVLLARPVELPLPRRRGPERAASSRVEVLSSSGEVLFAAPLPDASELRAELPDARTGKLRGVIRHKSVTAVTLRLPQLAGAEHVRLLDLAAGGVELARLPYPQEQP